MIMVEFRQEGSYRVKMDTPERNVVRAIASEFSISQEDAIAAILIRGMDSIGQQVKHTDSGKTLKQLWQEQGKGGD